MGKNVKKHEKFGKPSAGGGGGGREGRVRHKLEYI